VTTFSTFKKGHRCSHCGSVKTGLASRKDWNEVKDLFESNNCVLLTEEEEYFSNSKRKLHYICACGDQAYTTFTSFKSGSRCRECGNKRRIETNMNKYGVPHTTQVETVREKMKKTLFESGTAPCSTQQKYVQSIVGGELNYPVKQLSLDIAYVDEKIYIECDFSGHWLSIVHGTQSMEEFMDGEKRRKYALMRSGWKEIRIVSSKDLLPSDEMLNSMVLLAKRHLNQGQSWITFNIDKATVEHSNQVKHFEFGVLKRVSKKKVS